MYVILYMIIFPLITDLNPAPYASPPNDSYRLLPQCYGRIKRMEEGKIAQLLAQIGGPRNSPLGSDREGNLYWCYAGSVKLYVCSPPDRHGRNKAITTGHGQGQGQGQGLASGPGLGQPSFDGTTLRASPRTTASPIPPSSQVSRYLAVPPIHASLHTFGLMQVSHPLDI